MKDLFNALVLGLVALLPLINPPTTVALFIALSKGLGQEQKRRQASLTCVYVFLIMTVAFYLGELIMRAFSISIPGLRIAGGGILVIMGIRMLFPAPAPASPRINEEDRISFAFIPLAMPSTAGPGTIAMIISASATIRTNAAFPEWVLLAAPPLIFLATSVILWCCLLGADLIMKAVGRSGIDAISRLMGFLLVCMGAQFAINGMLEVMQGFVNFNAHLVRP
ncbi:MarC family NAAT transporter [Pseudomonas sp. v388]|uniref:MarC family NAAT transporter n=1 Tax=Pseudomonas sp. v388 TaxID=2479849 RepID=UPI000F77B79C|nr:MarC family NAAT transporter [Pseudomonas sp. v388]RRV04618.1 MarC family NAAT transporter [Pseudomonas sp. v388]